MMRTNRVISKLIPALIIVGAIVAIIWIVNVKVSYAIQILIALPIYLSGILLFNTLIKRQFDLDQNIVKTLDFVFSMIWFFILMYIVNKMYISK